MGELVEPRSKEQGDEGRLAREVTAFAAHGEHPEPGVLVAYQARTLGDEEADAVADHLAECRHCASLVLDLDELIGPAVPFASVEPAASVEPGESRPRVPGAGDAAHAPAALNRLELRAAPRWMLGAIAALLVLSSGLTVAVVLQSRQLAAKQAPQVGLQVVTLRAEGVTRSTGEEVAELKLPSTLILPLPGWAAGREVQVELRNPAGAVRWSGKSTPDRDSITIQLYLPASSLGAGRYVIEVRPAGTARGEPFARFPFRVRG